MNSIYAAVAPPIIAALIGLGIAGYLRHSLVEPELMHTECLKHVLAWQCQLRSAAIELFVNQRIAYLALALGAFGGALRGHWLAQVLTLQAIAVSAMGLVLYTAGLASFTLILAALVWAYQFGLREAGHESHSPNSQQ